MSCGVGCTCGLDPAFLWIWHSLAATALIRLLAWEPPYAMGVALEKAKKKKDKKMYCLIVPVIYVFCILTLFQINVLQIFSPILQIESTVGLFVCLSFLGTLPWHMEVPRLGV